MVQKSVPLANQVVQELLSAIDAGQLAGQDGLLPSEADLVQRYSVSRATLRQALAQLEQAGIIIRRHGVGTFVNRLIADQPAAIQYWLDDTASFSNLIRSSGHVAGCRILARLVQPASDFATSLTLSAADLVFLVEKVFYADQIPIIHCVNIVPRSLVSIPDSDLASAPDSWLESVYRFLEERCSRKVYLQKCQVTAVLAGEVLAQHLAAATGDPLLCSMEVGYAFDLSPLFVGQNHFRADAVSLAQTRRLSLSIAGHISAPESEGQ